MTYICPTEIHKERFADHEYTKLENGWEKFAKPGTIIDMLCFNCFNGYLIVTGDLGDAIYQWGEKVTTQWIAGCNLDYVLSKCKASEVGRDFEEWSPRECVVCLQTWWNDYEETYGHSPLEITTKCFEEGISRAHDSKFEWDMFLQENGDDLFGSDWYDGPPRWGYQPHIRGVLHLAALKVMSEKIHGPGETT